MYPYARELNQAGWFHLAFFAVFVPVLTLYGLRSAAGKPAPNRLRALQTTLLFLVCCASLSLLVADAQGISLFPRTIPPVSAIAAGFGMYVTMVTLMPPYWRKRFKAQAPGGNRFMPENAVELGWFVALSIVAGIGEEITWRGVQAALIGTLTGSFLLAWLFSAVSFAIAHMIQGWRAVAIVLCMAIGFHVLVWLSGSLYVAMALHVAYDVTAGIYYRRLVKEPRYAVEAATSLPAPLPTGQV